MMSGCAYRKYSPFMNISRHSITRVNGMTLETPYPLLWCINQFEPVHEISVNNAYA